MAVYNRAVVTREWESPNYSPVVAVAVLLGLGYFLWREGVFGASSQQAPAAPSGGLPVFPTLTSPPAVPNAPGTIWN